MPPTRKIAKIRRRAGRVSPTKRGKVARRVARGQISRGRPSLTGRAKRRAVKRRVGQAFPFGFIDTI